MCVKNVWLLKINETYVLVNWVTKYLVYFGSRCCKLSGAILADKHSIAAPPKCILSYNEKKVKGGAKEKNIYKCEGGNFFFIFCHYIIYSF